jgi:hypothetical protein
MTRKQRRAHALLWPVLALAMAAMTVAAVQERQRVAGAIAAPIAGPR